MCSMMCGDWLPRPNVPVPAIIKNLREKRQLCARWCPASWGVLLHWRRGPALAVLEEWQRQTGTWDMASPGSRFAREMLRRKQSPAHTCCKSCEPDQRAQPLAALCFLAQRSAALERSRDSSGMDLLNYSCCCSPSLTLCVTSQPHSIPVVARLAYRRGPMGVRCLIFLGSHFRRSHPSGLWRRLVTS